ncbi:hypothetical protein [Novosphingobium sp. SG707]|uniref:hypothetical protein n=1 Tax=Novosphingobium sp. SG707 TaxID=2586996 RepID=UPI0014452F74|nr:hypothetical protein [Novosphingobium sp. SG707]NKI98764.1 hypothetical protein [Novosphingobium sp. SG707]
MARPHGLIRPWLANADAGIDHPVVVHRVLNESGWSPRFISKVIMALGLAELGLPQSWPPMGIEAMPISPLSGPIIGLGVGLALFGLTGWSAFSAAPPFALRIECMSKGYLAAKSDIVRADRGSHQAGFMQLAPLGPKTVAKGA